MEEFQAGLARVSVVPVSCCRNWAFLDTAGKVVPYAALPPIVFEIKEARIEPVEVFARHLGRRSGIFALTSPGVS